jgi:transcriptional regulator with XRE-family HTH domain
MTRRPSTPLSPSQALPQQLKAARKERGWRQADLVARLEEIGARGWRQSKIAKIEAGSAQRITLDEALELAAALGVQPARLLTTDADVAVTPNGVIPRSDFRAWIAGSRPLPSPDDEGNARWVYFTSLLDQTERAALLAELETSESLVQNLIPGVPSTTGTDAEGPAEELRRRAQEKSEEIVRQRPE